MPNRDLKESNRRSSSLQLVSDAAERLWYRLITAVDDFGRLEADPEVVFTTCFQRVPKGWNIWKVDKCLHELATTSPAGQLPLIYIYTHESKRYLQINTASRHIYKRAKESKYPSPLSPQEIKDARTCAQVRTDSLESRIPILGSRFSNPDLKAVPEDDGTAARFQEFWQAYPARNGKKLEKAVTESRFQKLSPADQALAVRAARNYADSLRGQEISAKDPKRFFRDEYWRDWITEAQPTPVIHRQKILDPPPKAYLPAPVIDISKAEPCPPELVETMRRLGVSV